MMKILALSFVTLMSLSVQAQNFDGPSVGHGPGGHGPGPGPGGGHPPTPPGPGPGGGFGPGPGPGPGHGPGGPPPPPFGDPCNRVYDGHYSSGGPATFEFRSGRFGSEVIVYYSRQVWRARAVCDVRGFDFNVSGYRHSGRFEMRPPFGLGLEGTEYWRGRPYQTFSARARR